MAQRVPRRYRRRHIEAWQVWSLTRYGEMMLHAICLDNGLANEFRREIKYDPRFIRVWVELSRVNHLFSYENDDGTITVH